MMLSRQTTAWLGRGPFLGAALATWLAPAPLDLVPAVLGLVLFGVTHGALDHQIGAEARSTTRFVVRYLGGIGCFLLFWLAAPAVAIAGFFVLSADHFGECEFVRLRGRPPLGWRERAPALFWGLAVSLLAALTHWTESLPGLRQMLRAPLFAASLPAFVPPAAAVVLCLVALLAASHHGAPAVSATLPLLLVLAALPQIPGFLCFFAFWHSLDSIAQQRAERGLSLADYLKQGAPLAAVAWAGLFFLRAVAGHGVGQLDFYPALFLLLAALTVSHAAVMRRFYTAHAIKDHGLLESPA